MSHILRQSSSPLAIHHKKFRDTHSHREKVCVQSICDDQRWKVMAVDAPQMAADGHRWPGQATMISQGSPGHTRKKKKKRRMQPHLIDFT